MLVIVNRAVEAVKIRRNRTHAGLAMKMGLGAEIAASLHTRTYLAHTHMPPLFESHVPALQHTSNTPLKRCGVVGGDGVVLVSQEMGVGVFGLGLVATAFEAAPSSTSQAARDILVPVSLTGGGEGVQGRGGLGLLGLLLDQMGGGLVRDWIQGPFGASVYHVQGDFQGNFHGVGDEATSDGSGGHDISKARGRHSAIPSIIPFTIPSTIPSTILSTIPVHASDLEGSIRGRGRGSCRAVYGALDPYILHAIGMESTIHPSRNSSAAAADAAGGDVEWAATVGEVGGKLRLKMSLCRKPLMEYVLPLLHFDEIVPRTDTHTERDCFYYIIEQIYDVGLHSRRHPMEFDAGTRPFASVDAPSS